MKLPKIKFYKKWLLTGVLVICVSFSALMQTVFCDPLDKTKQAVSRWPWLSSPHLEFAITLFESGSDLAYKELSLAQNLPLKNWENINLTKIIIQKPESAKLQIKLLEKIQAEKFPSTEIARRLALLHLTIYQDTQAFQYLKKMEYLDPQGESTITLSETLKSFKN